MKFIKGLGKISLEENLRNNLSDYSVTKEEGGFACLIIGEKYFFEKKEERWIFEMLICLHREYKDFVKLDKVAQKKNILQNLRIVT